MPRKIADEVRERILAMAADHQSPAAIAQELRLSQATVYRVLRAHRLASRAARAS